MSKWLVDIHGEIEGDYELICKAEDTISLDRVKQFRNEIVNMNSIAIIQRLDKLIAESEGNK